MKSIEDLSSFIEYCAKNPQQRFWQALRNWAEVDRVYTSMDEKGLRDTFYWEQTHRSKPACPDVSHPSDRDEKLAQDAARIDAHNKRIKEMMEVTESDHDTIEAARKAAIKAREGDKKTRLHRMVNVIMEEGL